MKTRTLALLAATLLCGAGAFAAQPVPDAAADPNAFFKTPGWLGQNYFAMGEYAKLEALVADVAKTRARAEDGQFELYMLTSNLEESLGNWAEDMDAQMASKFKEWRTQVPGSVFEPIVASMQVCATAWRARGQGYSSTVTEEGWRLFRERNRRAWQMLMDHKKESSALPTWYALAIEVGIDAKIDGATLRNLFDEGIRRYPGYHSIYFAYTRQLAPRWGGSYAEADAFIREQVAAKTNPEGEVLYARLYWLLDQTNGGSPSFFEESLVSWPRMRKGFERLMLDFPASKSNQAAFAGFACRARDATTYGFLRGKVDAGEFRAAAPDGISLDVCDARFMKKT